MVSNTNMAMHYRGLADDTKPTDGIPNGSDFLEMDTGKTWYYDADSGDWVDPTAVPEDPDEPQAE